MFSLEFSLKRLSGVFWHHILDVRFHSLGAGNSHCLFYMAVLLQRKGCAVMSEVFLDRLCIIPVFQRGGCEAVTEIVESAALAVDLFYKPFVVVVHCVDSEV